MANIVYLIIVLKSLEYFIAENILQLFILMNVLSREPQIQNICILVL